MLNSYGCEAPSWEMAKAEARGVMLEVAKANRTIAYSDLVAKIGAIEIGAHDPRLFHLLGEVSSEEVNASRAMLTAVVVHKSGDMQTGPGFYKLAKSLGRGAGDEFECWVRELKSVYETYL